MSEILNLIASADIGSSGILKRTAEEPKPAIEIAARRNADGTKRLLTTAEFMAIRGAQLGGMQINEREIQRSAEDNYVGGGVELPVERRFYEPISASEYDRIRGEQMRARRAEQEREELKRRNSRPW
jgi:hypothetical protein